VPVTRPRLFKLSFALLLAAVAIGGCSVDDASTRDASCSGLNCADHLPTQGDGPQIEGMSPTADASTPPPTPAKEACGVGYCIPDDPRACADYSEGGSQEDPSSGDAGTPANDAGLDAGATDGGLDGGPLVTELDGSFERPPTSTSTPSDYGCQVSVTIASSVERSCGAAGNRGVEEACTSSRDCQPGLGCVGPVRAGRCLPFCCTIGPDTCSDGYYCANRPLREEMLGEAPGPLVPVCDRADGCNLGEPEDCTGPTCLCGAGMACTLVKPDRTTACVKPGEGLANQDCPCAAGFVCSQATQPGMCVKTCDLDETDSETCGPGVCQASPALPEGWGICVGATPNQMMQP
jgi:hypothetical protein